MKTILVVDDTHSERQMLSALLSHVGYKVEATDSAESAWEWLEKNPLPNLIVLDIIMPGEGGLELCRKVRSHPEKQQVAILFCSSKSHDFDRFWALRQGGNDYIHKPYAPQDLLETVSRYLN